MVKYTIYMDLVKFKIIGYVFMGLKNILYISYIKENI